MQLSRKALNSRWAWTSVGAIAVLVVLNLVDTWLRAKSGYGTADLQFMQVGAIYAAILAWSTLPNAVLAGFGLGLDFLFMPLYAAALFYGSVAAVDRFAPKEGRLRRVLTVFAMAPVAAAIFDACENALQIAMLTGGPTATFAAYAMQATTAKYAGIAIGLVLTLGGVAGLFWKRR
jgi:hypothetical protein